MEVRDFREGWSVKIYDHRISYWNAMNGKVVMIKKYIIYVEIDGSEDVISCLPHELIILDKNGC